MKGSKAMRLPTIFIPVGGYGDYGGHTYECIIRRDRDLPPCRTCEGCAFVVGNCPPLWQCSKFDRRDKRNVWFRRVK